MYIQPYLKTFVTIIVCISLSFVFLSYCLLSVPHMHFCLYLDHYDQVVLIPFSSSMSDLVSKCSNYLHIHIHQRKYFQLLLPPVSLPFSLRRQQSPVVEQNCSHQVVVVVVCGKTHPNEKAPHAPHYYKIMVQSVSDELALALPLITSLFLQLAILILVQLHNRFFQKSVPNLKFLGALKGSQ